MKNAFSRVGVLLLALISSVHAANGPGSRDDGINAGYQDLYNLQFEDAHKVFAQWQQLHPDDPLGPVSDAAAYLFSEFDRLHILQIEFFAQDRNFQSQHSLIPDPVAKQRFTEQLDKTRRLADAELSRNPNDANALFASVLLLGLRGDYIALIEKRNFAGLSYLKEARERAQKLLRIDPSCYDAYVAVGVENYMLSLKPAPVRWILQLGGAETDKTTGIKDLRLTAERGHFLLPYARLLLAVAALRDNDRTSARNILQQLARTYPNNHLYVQELASLH
jgi:tetratricopeptide (TPR) repeat protein